MIFTHLNQDSLVGLVRDDECFRLLCAISGFPPFNFPLVTIVGLVFPFVWREAILYVCGFDILEAAAIVEAVPPSIIIIIRSYCSIHSTH